MSKLRNKFVGILYSLPVILLSSATSVLAVTTSSGTPPTTPTVAGGALPSDNPFTVNWGNITQGGLAQSLLPLLNYGLGIYGLYLLFHGIRHLLHKSKKLMEGEIGYKEFIPVAAGFAMVLLVLSGAWYHLLLAVLVPLNNAFASQQ